MIIATAAALIHVAEEYFLGWVEWANGFVSGITIKQFVIINILFITLCIIAAALHEKYVVVTSSIFSLLLINALVHVAPTIRQKKYSPGLVSAILLFIPVGISGYLYLFEHDLLSVRELMISIIIGALWMSIPFVFQVMRMASERKA